MNIPLSKTTQHVEFIEYFKDLEDPRQAKKLIYPFDEILFLVLCGVLCGANGWMEISVFGQQKLQFLKRFFPFADATPSHDQLGYIFSRLDSEQFQSCFISWVSSLQKSSEGVIAVDGKTLRRSFDKGGEKGAIHMVSAWCCAQNLVLGQVQVNDKSNEITAIPKLLELLEIEGAIITIDAMGCQRDIAQNIIDKQADYIFSLKGNQGTLHKDIEDFFNDHKKRNTDVITKGYHDKLKRKHGRIELRRVTVCNAINTLQGSHKWPGLKTIIMREYLRSENDEITTETWYYISSLDEDATFMASAIKDHWAIENKLHWVMDMVFRDDECRVRKDNAPANFTTIKHMANNILRQNKGKQSMNVKRHIAAWNEDFLAELITG